MSKVFIRQSMLTLTADFNPGSPQWSYDRGDDGNSPRRIDFDDAANLLRRMLMPTDNHHPLPDYITLKGAHAVNVDYSQNWGRMCCASVDVASAEAMEIYGVGWTAVMSANMQSVVSKFVAMCSTPGGLEWWERRFRLENAIRNLNVYAQMDMPRAAYRAEYEHIQSDPEFKNIEAPDFIGDTLLATKFAELDIAITGKKPQGYKRYPFRFEDIAMSSNLIYLNDGGYSRLGLFLNTDDTLRVLIYMNEKSDHHGRQHDDDVTAKIRDIQEAATTWYRQHLQAEEKRAAEDAAERKWRGGGSCMSAAPRYHSHSKILHGYTNPRSFMALSHGVFTEAVAAGKDGFSAVQDFLDGTELKHGHPIRTHILARIAKEHPSG